MFIYNLINHKTVWLKIKLRGHSFVGRKEYVIVGLTLWCIPLSWIRNCNVLLWIFFRLAKRIIGSRGFRNQIIIFRTMFTRPSRCVFSFVQHGWSSWVRTSLEHWDRGTSGGQKSEPGLLVRNGGISEVKSRDILHSTLWMDGSLSMPIKRRAQIIHHPCRALGSTRPTPKQVVWLGPLA